MLKAIVIAAIALVVALAVFYAALRAAGDWCVKAGFAVSVMMFFAAVALAISSAGIVVWLIQ